MHVHGFALYAHTQTHATTTTQLRRPGQQQAARDNGATFLAVVHDKEGVGGRAADLPTEISSVCPCTHTQKTQRRVGGWMATAPDRGCTNGCKRVNTQQKAAASGRVQVQRRAPVLSVKERCTGQPLGRCQHWLPLAILQVHTTASTQGSIRSLAEATTHVWSTAPACSRWP